MERFDIDNFGDIHMTEDGIYTDAEEAQAEIARLTAEVEEAREKLRLAVKSADLADAAIDTAWNDAIEAAAVEAANWWAYLHDDPDRKGPVAAAIRALSRPAGSAE